MEQDKPTLTEFCKMTGKKKHQVHYLFKIHPRLKCKVQGEKESRIDWKYWQKLINAA